MAAASKSAAVFAFDVLARKRKDLHGLPLLKRKAALQKVVDAPTASSTASTSERAERSYSRLRIN
jgi:ATP-dependent DNA ligase